MRRLVLLLIAFPALGLAAPAGIPRDLARRRAAAISNVHYELAFDLRPKAATAPGREAIRFDLTSPQPLLLDYRDGHARRVVVNGSDLPGPTDNGHILLPRRTLRAGANEVDVEFESGVAPAGKAILRFEDKDDGSEYLYTLFVPMDASMAFPCFDQPDIKGKFKLAVTAPPTWTVISNTAGRRVGELDDVATTAFDETPPIPTYVFAFAAGNFRKIERPGMPGLYVRQSRLEQAQVEARAILETAQEGIEYLTGYFAQPFPFPKYDMVLIPGLAYGGMEHAGATFIREEGVLFRAAPTHADLLARDVTVLHELAHQWFGDSTTMRWFDDLWLKEGFAQYMAYQTLAALRPGEPIWKRFYETIKPPAYAIDSTKGTTPIFQHIANLKDAKSAYGAIVYFKAPGVLRQLAFVVGDERFRDGLRLYLGEHRYGNAEWSDLVHALERASGRSLGAWSSAWIKRRGMPQVDVRWACAAGKISDFVVSQKDVLGESGPWPIATQVLLDAPDAEPQVLRVELVGGTATVPRAIGQPCPRTVFANHDDRAYGRFLLDARSRAALLEQMPPRKDLLERALLFGSLWEAVREAELAPRQYIEAAVRALAEETDEDLAASLVAHTIKALHYYVSDDARAQLVPAIERLAARQMTSAGEPGLRIVWFRALRSVAETPEARAKLKALLGGTLSVPGVQLRQLDRWSLVVPLIAQNDPDATALLAAERERDRTGDGLKYAYVVEAARPDAETKKRYFEDYLHDPRRPEDWIEQSLWAFNLWNQSELTEPYLRAALDALPRMKQQRKIFFVLAWLEAFIGGQRSAAAAALVHWFADAGHAEPDTRLKIIQVADELDRTVRIRRKFRD